MCATRESGLAAARNGGFRASKGEYVVFLDADDRLTPNAVESHLACFAHTPEAGFVVGDIDHIRWMDHMWLASLAIARSESERGAAAGEPCCEYDRGHVSAGGVRTPRRFRARLFAGGGLRVVASGRKIIPQPTSSDRRRTISPLFCRLSRKGTLMLKAMNQVMRLKWDEVKDNSVLLSAWRKGNTYWKDHLARPQ